MFGSFRFKNIRFTVICLVCAAAFVAIGLVVLHTGAPDTVEPNGGSCSLSVEDEGDIIDFISRCGREVEGIVTDMEITVPNIWNDTYTRYNELQMAQGLDLTYYKGKPAHEYIYALSDGGCAEIVTAGGRIIAAHLSEPDGSDQRPLIEK